MFGPEVSSRPGPDMGEGKGRNGAGSGIRDPLRFVGPANTTRRVPSSKPTCRDAEEAEEHARQSTMPIGSRLFAYGPLHIRTVRRSEQPEPCGTRRPPRPNIHSNFLLLAAPPTGCAQPCSGGSFIFDILFFLFFTQILLRKIANRFARWRNDQSLVRPSCSRSRDFTADDLPSPKLTF
jgi:hypothetical protein